MTTPHARITAGSRSDHTFTPGVPRAANSFSDAGPYSTARRPNPHQRPSWCRDGGYPGALRSGLRSGPVIVRPKAAYLADCNCSRFAAIALNLVRNVPICSSRACCSAPGGSLRAVSQSLPAIFSRSCIFVSTAFRCAEHPQDNLKTVIHDSLTTVDAQPPADCLTLEKAKAVNKGTRARRGMSRSRPDPLLARRAAAARSLTGGACAPVRPTHPSSALQSTGRQAVKSRRQSCAPRQRRCAAASIGPKNRTLTNRTG